MLWYKGWLETRSTAVFAGHDASFLFFSYSIRNVTPAAGAKPIFGIAMRSSFVV